MVIASEWLRWIVALPALGVLFHVFFGRRAPGAVKVIGPGVVGAAFVVAVGCAIGKVSMEAVSRSIMVFYIPMIIVLLLVTYIPALTLWLPSFLK